MPILLQFLMVLVLTSCASVSDGHYTTAKAVGLWKESSSTMYAITLRKADGTYQRKEIQVYDYAKSPIEYESAGSWNITGHKYTLNIERITAAIWQKDIGKKWTMEILDQTKNLFKYLSTDGAIVEEQKIGEPTEAQFDSASLKQPKK